MEHSTPVGVQRAGIKPGRPASSSDFPARIWSPRQAPFQPCLKASEVTVSHRLPIVRWPELTRQLHMAATYVLPFVHGLQALAIYYKQESILFSWLNISVYTFYIFLIHSSINGHIDLVHASFAHITRKWNSCVRSDGSEVFGTLHTVLHNRTNSQSHLFLGPDTAARVKASPLECPFKASLLQF